MKYLITILFLFSRAFAMNYYVSASGNNSNDGLTPSTSWLTISKVIATVAQGDSVFFNGGDSWNEALLSPVKNVYYGSYGTGMPIITGFQTVSLTDSSHFWSGDIAATSINVVTVNGILAHMARYPNTGYLTVTSVTQNSLVGSLTGTPNYTGAYCVYRTAHYVLDRVIIASQSAGTLNFRSSLTYNPNSFGGTGYFIQNSLSALDQNGEWYFDSSRQKLYVYYDSVLAPDVKYSAIGILVTLKDSSTIDGINIRGANSLCIKLDSTRNNVIKNSVIELSSVGILAGGCKQLNLTDNIWQDFQNNSIYCYYYDVNKQCDSFNITGNIIKRNGVVPGMGGGGVGSYNAVILRGHNGYFYKNTIDSAGYCGVSANGRNSVYRKNKIANTNFVLDDGGGFYTVIGSAYPANENDGMVIDSCIILNAIGATAGTSSTSYAANIYLDDDSKNITVSNCFLQNGFSASLFLHNTDSLTITGNTIIDSLGVPVYFYPTTGNNFSNNIVYSKNNSYPCLQITSYTGVLNNNYYSKPSNENTSLKQGSSNYSLSRWQALGFDRNSSKTPSGITSALPTVLYDGTFSLTGTYFSMQRGVYTDSATIPSYTGLILFKAKYDRYHKAKNVLKYSIR